MPKVCGIFLDNKLIETTPFENADPPLELYLDIWTNHIYQRRETLTLLNDIALKMQLVFDDHPDELHIWQPILLSFVLSSVQNMLRFPVVQYCPTF